MEMNEEMKRKHIYECWVERGVICRIGCSCRCHKAPFTPTDEDAPGGAQLHIEDFEEQKPKPFLTQTRVDELLEVLGFNFQPDGQLRDYPEQRLRFGALQELIAGAIADWADIEPDILTIMDNDTVAAAWEAVDKELQEWAQEWLVG